MMWPDDDQDPTRVLELQRDALLAALKKVDVLLSAVCIGTDNGTELIGPYVREVMEVAADVSAVIARVEGATTHA